MGQKLETYIGAAQFYAQERGLVNAPLVPLGNCTKATFSWQTSDKKLMDMQSLAGGTFDHVSLIEGGELDLEISQLNKANLVRMMYGSSAVIAAGPVTDESHIWAGSGPVLLNYIPDSAAIVVKDDAAAITYVLGTDYEVLEGRLGIQPLAGGAILSGDEIKVTYARKEQYDIETLTAANKEYRLFIVGLNKADTVDGDPQKITIHRIKFGPAGFDLVGDDFAKPSTKGTLLAAPEIVGAGKSKYASFRRAA
jgi:hypothetical protein